MSLQFPLNWPKGRGRTDTFDKKSGQAFKRSLLDAVELLEDEVRRMGGTYLVISCNLKVGLRGGTTMEGGDTGVAVYFQLDGKPTVFANDSYIDLAHNINAIANTIAALRGIERWGSRETMTQAFSGFAALPPPVESWNWRQRFASWGYPDLPAINTLIDAAYADLAKQFHPDRGGDAARMAQLNEARDAAKAELKGK